MDNKDKKSFDSDVPLTLTKISVSSLNKKDIDDKNEKSFDSHIPLILTKIYTSNSEKENIINSQKLTIKPFIKTENSKDEKIVQRRIKGNLQKNFFYIKETAKRINNDIQKKSLLINSSIQHHENKLQKLYIENPFEKKLLNQNKIQTDIIDNQQKLNASYKKDLNDIKLNLGQIKNELTEVTYSKKFLEENNNKLKTTINTHITNNKKLKDTINYLGTTEIKELNDKIKFYQDENIRLSNELTAVQKKHEKINQNFTEAQKEKNDIYNKIQVLNTSLTKNNVVGSPFKKEIVKEDSINAKVLNDITINNLNEDKYISKSSNDLDDEIKNIFNR